MIRNHFGVFVILVLFFTNLSTAQQRNFWIHTDDSQTLNKDKISLKRQKAFALELLALKEELKRAPQRDVYSGRSNTKVVFPDANGKMVAYLVKETSVMHPKLSRKYPNIKTYMGVSEKDGTKKIHFSVTKLGLYAVISNLEGGTQYIEPFDGDKEKYRVYFRSDLEVKQDFECLVGPSSGMFKSSMAKLADDGVLRTYQLALACTGEYAQYHIAEQNAGGGTDAEKKAVVLSAMTAAMTKVNAIYENDLAITMQLVANNDDLIFLDPTTDPYTNLDQSAMLGENQTTCDDVIGPANYDIGHVFGTGGGGVSSLLVVCRDGSKARGVTGLPEPVGDYFYYDYVAHEMGHQFGANHTFNGSDGLCDDANRNEETAVETGSGSSLMSYAGLCDPQNVQGSVDPYFHTVSIEEIRTYVTSGTGSGCASETDLVSNLNPPVADAGEDFTIPIGTAFRLSGTGSDADNDVLSYNWEQIDNGAVPAPPSENSTSGALYRSFMPSLDPVRYLPNMNTLLTGFLSSTWEVTPNVAREMNFALTVRDNNAEAGQVTSDQVLVTVTDAAGPFTVTSQNTEDLVWTPGTQETITWDVAGTDGNGVNVSQVNILLSTDWGKSFTTVLASNVVNDGTQVITVPDMKGSQCFVMVEAVGNHFFALNGKSFSIGEFNTVCSVIASEDTPIDIPDNDRDGTVSMINVPDNINVESLQVRLVDESNPSLSTPGITHTYLGDLTITLESPEGTIVELVSRSCDAMEDIQVVFSDDGDPFMCNTFDPGISGIRKPFEELSRFNGENAQGNWILRVVDAEPRDVGTIESWSMEICSSEAVLGVNNYVFDQFNVYPNPSDGIFNIKVRSEETGDVEVVVYDLLGRKLVQRNYRELSNTFERQLDLQGMSGGIYILSVKRGNKMSSQKIHIE